MPGRGKLGWVFSTENSKRPLTRDFIWTKRMRPFLKPIGLDWATFQVMRRTHASRSKEAGVDAHTRSAQMSNTVDVNENEYAVSDFKTRREAVRKLEAALTVKVKTTGSPRSERLFKPEASEVFGGVWPEGVAAPSSQLREVIGS